MVYVETDETDAEGFVHPFPLGPIGCFRERLKTAMGSAGARAFARKCGLSEGAIRSYLSGDTYPTLDRLAQIADATGVEAMWLAFGGPSGIQAKPPIKESAGDYATSVVLVPLYAGQCAVAGDSWRDGATILKQLPMNTEEARRRGLVPDNLAALRVDGDPMAGLVGPGDDIMFDHSRNQLEADAVYIIRLDGYLQPKRLQRQLDGSVAILSQNKAYRDILVPRDHLQDLEIVGRAVWAGAWLL